MLLNACLIILFGKGEGSFSVPVDLCILIMYGTLSYQIPRFISFNSKNHHVDLNIYIMYHANQF